MSSQQFYTPIKPLPEPKDLYCTLSVITQRVALALLFGSYSAIFGSFFGLLGRSVSVFQGALCGFVVGVVCIIAFSVFFVLPTPIENYRISTLKQLEEVTQNPRALAALSNLKNFFYYPFKSFIRPFDYALLHNEITVVTTQLDKERSDTLEVWGAFLKHLHGVVVKLPNAESVVLDMSQEFRRLKGHIERVDITWLTSRLANPSKKCLEDMDVILNQTIGLQEKNELNIMRQNFKHHCVACRDRGTNQVVGMGWYFQNKGVIEIGGLCRKPEYSRWGIGSLLLQEILRQFKSPQIIVARLRKSNPAIRLFREFGFEVQGENLNYYKEGPKEDGVLLKLCWKSYQNALN